MDANKIRGQLRLPLQRAVDWILSEHGTKIWDDRSVYAEEGDGDGDTFRNYSKEYSNAALLAAGELLERLKDGGLKAHGYRDGDETRELEEISPGAFPNDVADNPYGSTPIEALLPSDRPKRHLMFGDSAQIRSFRTVHWSGIVISGDDVLRLWPAHVVTPSNISEADMAGVVNRTTPASQAGQAVDFATRELSGKRASISAVIDWIASGGGSRFDPDSSELHDQVRKWLAEEQLSPSGLEMSLAYQAAIDEFMNAAYENKLAVKGFRGSDRDSARESVPDDLFENAMTCGWYFCPRNIEYDCVTARNRSYFSLGRIDGDQIKRDGKTIWSGLIVDAAAALKLWQPPGFQFSLAPIGDCAATGELPRPQRRTKSIKLSEYMCGQFDCDPGKSVGEWRRYFRLKNMNEYAAADEDTILKACGIAWPPK